jgi:hypothetical protein
MTFCRQNCVHICCFVYSINIISIAQPTPFFVYVFIYLCINQSVLSIYLSACLHTRIYVSSLIYLTVLSITQFIWRHIILLVNKNGKGCVIKWLM